VRFFNVQGELDGRIFSRSYGEEVRIALSAVDCVLDGERAIYGSSELTTGKSLYKLLRELRLRDVAELKQALGEEELARRLWNPNIEEANAFAGRLRQRLGGALVVTPAPFAAPGWSQPEYLAFWETLIRTRFGAVYFNQSWQYSNGCTFEFAVARDCGISTLDADGHEISLERGMATIGQAAAELEAEGFDVARLRENLRRLELLRSPTQGRTLMV